MPTLHPDRHALLEKCCEALTKLHDEELSLIPEGSSAYCNAMAQVTGQILLAEAPPDEIEEIIANYVLVMVAACYGDNQPKRVLGVLVNCTMNLIALYTKHGGTKPEVMTAINTAWNKLHPGT